MGHEPDRYGDERAHAQRLIRPARVAPYGAKAVHIRLRPEEQASRQCDIIAALRMCGAQVAEAMMRDNDIPSEMRNSAAPAFASDGYPGDDFVLREKLAETGTARACSDREGSPISEWWDKRYESGYDELMERDSERERYQAIGQIVVALPAHSSLLDVGCGVGTMADYLPALDYTGVDVSHKALAIARNRHSGTFICSDVESFRIDKKFDVILFSEILYYLEDPLGQLVRYREFLSDEGSMIVSIWLPDPEHPKRELHMRVIDEIIHSDVFARCPMQMHDVGEAELRWKVICIDVL